MKTRFDIIASKSNNGMFVIPLFLFQNFRVMLDIPSQYMHYCFVLLCEVCCVSLLGLGIIVVFFVT